jgi:hypothetical protein
MFTGNPDPQVWDPVTSSFLSVPTNDGANIFCAGQIVLADGRVLSAGGHANNHVGLAAGRSRQQLVDVYAGHVVRAVVSNAHAASRRPYPDAGGRDDVRWMRGGGP